MYRDRTISLIIPCRNERAGLEEVFPSIPSCVDEVIVVDYRSTDGTPDYARGKGAVVVDIRKRGYGAAYKAGFARARGDIIAACDGDGTYPVSSIPAVIDSLLDGGLDFISCCRFPLCNQGSMHRMNFLGNMVITVIANVLFRYKITDLLSGMWVFKKQALDAMRLVDDGWNFSEEIKIEAFSREGLRFSEHHIHYSEREGQTKLHPFSVGIKNILFLLYKRIVVGRATRR
jgi:glycosyltransferase involved in cell wall biosynthesis